MEDEEIITQDQLGNILGGDDNLEEKALSALVKTGKSKKAQNQEKLKRVLDFKFRVVELIEIFIKKSKDPAIFISQIIPLVQTIRDSHRDNKKNSYVNKLCNILNTYFQKDKSKLVEFDINADDIILEILQSSRKLKSPKISKLFRFILQTLLEIKTKFIKGKSIMQPVINAYVEALEDFGTKRGITMPKEIFGDFITKFPELGVELFDKLVQLSNLKENEGARDDFVRNECLDLLLQSLKPEKTNEVLDEKILHNYKSIKSLLISVLVNHEKIQKKKNSTLMKYMEVFVKTTEHLNKMLANKKFDSVYREKIKENKTKLKATIKKALEGLDPGDQNKDMTRLKTKYLAKIEDL